MKKVYRSFFYVFFISILNSIYLLASPENIAVPQWFKTLEELKKRKSNPGSERWIMMFNILPADIQNKIKAKIHARIDEEITAVPKTGFPSGKHYIIKTRNETFATLALQVSDFVRSDLRIKLKTATMILLKNSSSSTDYESKALNIMFQELWNIVNLDNRPGYNATQCAIRTISLPE